MPFSDLTHHPYTEQGVATYAPTGSGVYGIYNANEWLYVGEAENIEKRVYEHLREQSEQGVRIARRLPTGFVFESVAGELARKVRERSLIAELNPTCNR